jgi:Arc/MetJ-type ribon-helix-helix transcriptional regulator
MPRKKLLNVKKSYRISPITVEFIQLLRDTGHYRSDAEVIDWALESLAGEEGLDVQGIKFKFWYPEEIKDLQ